MKFNTALAIIFVIFGYSQETFPLNQKTDSEGRGGYSKTFTHQDGNETTITKNPDGTTTTQGWYGGSGTHTQESFKTMEKEVQESGEKHNNPVVRERISGDK